METKTSNTPAGGGVPAEADNRNLFGILAYLGPLVIVSYLMAKDDAFIKFHARQGAVLFGIEIIVWILSSFVAFLWMLWWIFDLIDLGVFVLAIIGIVNVLNKREAELPLVGGFAKNIPL